MTPRDFGRLHGFTKAQAVDLASRGLIESATLNPYSKRWEIPEGAQLADWLQSLPVPAAPKNLIAECVSQRAARPSRAGAMPALLGHAGPHPSPSGWDALHAPSASLQAPQGRAVGLSMADDDGEAVRSGAWSVIAEGSKAASEYMQQPVQGIPEGVAGGASVAALAATDAPHAPLPGMVGTAGHGGEVGSACHSVIQRTGDETDEAQDVLVYRRPEVQAMCLCLRRAVAKQARQHQSLWLDAVELVQVFEAVDALRRKARSAAGKGLQGFGAVKATEGLWRKVQEAMQRAHVQVHLGESRTVPKRHRRRREWVPA